MKTQVVSFHCVLKNKLGKVLSSTFNHEVIADSEGDGALLQGLVEGMRGLQKGEKRTIALSAEKAYGFYEPRLSIEVARTEIDSSRKLRVGHEVVFPAFDGKQRAFRIIRLTRDSLFLDANHALAGQDLVFDIEATDTRDMTIAESEDISKPEKGYLH